MPDIEKTSIRILLVDDTYEFRHPLALTLKQIYGYQVDEADRAPAALELARQNVTYPYHIALIDQVLEGDMDGLTLLRSLRAIQPQIDAILLTAFSMEPQSAALQAGAYRFLQKPISAEQLDLLIELCIEAQQARSALNQASRDREFLEKQLSLSLELAKELDQNAILQATYQILSTLIDGENISIVLINKLSGKLDYVLSYNKNTPLPIPSQTFGLESKPGLIELLIRQRAPLLFVDLPKENLAGELNIDLADETLRSWLGVPLLVGDQSIGAITVHSSLPGRFDSTDQRMLMSIANLVAQALYNARLYTQLHVLDDITRHIAEINEPDKLLREVSHDITRLVDARNLRIGLHREFRGRVDLMIRYDHGKLLEPISLPISEGLIAYTICYHHSLLLKTPAEIDAFCKERSIRRVGEPAKSWLSVPLVVNDNLVIGAIGLQDFEHEHAYDKQDQELLTRLASHLAVAVYKALLSEQVVRGIRQQQMLTEITAFVNTQNNIDKKLDDLDNEKGYWVFLTGVTANFGLGFNRAMLFRWEPDILRPAERGHLSGWLGLGDMENEKARSTWESLDKRRITSFQDFINIEPEDYNCTPVQKELERLRIEMSIGSEDGFAQAVFRSQASIIQADTPFDENNPYIAVFQPREFAIVPLKTGPKLAGVLVVDNKFNLKPIEDDDLKLLISFSNAVMNLLDNHNLRMDLERRVDVLQHHYKVVTALRTGVRKEEILPLIVQTLRDLYQLDTCTLGFLSKDGTELIFPERYQLGLKGEVRRSIQNIPARYWDTIKTSENPCVFADLRNEPELRTLLENYDLESFVIQPVRDRDAHLLGVMTLGRRGALTVKEDDYETIRALASQVALAVQNAEMIQNIEHRIIIQKKMLDIAHHISSAVSGSDLSVLQTIVNDAQQLTGAHCVVLYPFRPETKTYDLDRISATGLISDKSPKDFGEKERTGRGSMTGIVLKNKLLIVDDVNNKKDQGKKTIIRNEPGKFLQREGIRSFVGVCLQAGPDSLGALFVNFRQPHVFSNEEIIDIQTFATHAAIAIEKDRLLARTKQLASTQLTALLGLQRAEELVIQPETPLKEVWRAILATAMKVTGANHGCILELNRNGIDLELRVAIPKPEPKTITHVGISGISGWAAQHRRTARVGDVQIEPWKNRYVKVNDSTRSEMDVPIIGPERDLLGVISLESDRKNAFTNDGQHLVEGLASAAAVAYYNADRYRQITKRQRYLEAHIAAAQVITASLDRKTTLDRILEQAVKLTEVDTTGPAHFGAIMLWDENRQSLIFSNVYPHEDYPPLTKRIGDYIPLPKGIRLRSGKWVTGLTGRAAMQRQAIVSGDVHKEPDYLPYSRKTHSELVIPILDKRKLIGVINIEHQKLDAFNEDDEMALSLLAQQAVIAIRNAEAYQELENTREELAASTAIAYTNLLGSTLVHDIQGYAAAIRNASLEVKQIIANSTLVEPTIAPLQDVLDATGRIQEIAGNLRMHPSGQEDVLNLTELLKDKLNNWKRMYRNENIDWQIRDEFGEFSSWMRINRLAISIVLDNLVKNAVQALFNQPVKKITLSTRKNGDRIEIDLQDNGPGIPEDIRRKLFKIPVHKDTGQKGSGMGLLIAHFILTALGGSITCLSKEPRSGATFRIWLPNP